MQRARHAGDDVGEIVERVPPRLRREVRRQDHVLELQQLVVVAARRLVERVEREAAEPAGLQRLDQRRAVDHARARHIDDEGARLHARELRARR